MPQKWQGWEVVINWDEAQGKFGGASNALYFNLCDTVGRYIVIYIHTHIL